MNPAPGRKLINLAFVIAFLLGSLALSMLVFGPLIGFVWWSPLFAFIANRWLLNGACRFLAWNKAVVLGPLNGRYYAFDGFSVTVDWDERSIRVLADDVFRILEIKADDVTRRKLALRCGAEGFFEDSEGRLWFGEEALLDFISRRTRSLDARALRLHTWFARQVFMPLHRKRENGKVEHKLLTP